MKEYKIWKFIPGKYLQTVTVSQGTKNIKTLYILDFYIEFLQMNNYKEECNPQAELII